MRYTIARLDIVLTEVFARPVLALPQKAVDVLQQFYDALSPRHPINLEDLQSFGGNSFGDVKLVVNTFSGKGVVEIRPNGVVLKCFDLVSSEEDLKTIRDYMITCEAALKAALPVAHIESRTFRANMWIDCSGGADEGAEFLERLGNRTFNLGEGQYAKFRKEFTFQFALSDDVNDTRLVFSVQPSYIGRGQLFVQGEFVYKLDERRDSLETQFDRSRKEFESVLSYVGLEPEVA